MGFADTDLPRLRYVTQATARMAYLSPALAPAHPHTIGIPIPGGSFRIEPIPDHPDPDIGELVYSGPNVMLGYAHRPNDLRLGRTVEELRTGDLARRTDAGLYEIVGRTSRFAKVFGLRIDLQRDDASCIGRVPARASGLPRGCVRVCPVAELPRTTTGKPDYRAVRQLADTDTDADAGTPKSDHPAPGGPDVEALRAFYAEILDRTDTSTFVGLGGDSLSYVRMSLRLEQALGYLPAHWHTTRIRDFDPAPHGANGSATSSPAPPGSPSRASSGSPPRPRSPASTRSPPSCCSTT